MFFRNKWILIGGIGLILLISVFFVYEKLNKPPDPALKQLMLPEEAVKSAKPKSFAKDPKKEKEATASTVIMVDVKGQVNRPGVYRLTNGKRVLDAVRMAGGFTAQAEQKTVNLARKLTDEMVIYIPKKGEKSIPLTALPETASSTASSPASNTDSAVSPIIHINSATIEQLQELPGIGPSKAGAILKYRTEHGPFQKVEDLTNVPGIGDKSLAKMKDQIDLN